MTRPAFAGAVLDPALPSRRSAHISTFPADHTQSDQTFNSARQGAQPWRQMEPALLQSGEERKTIGPGDRGCGQGRDGRVGSAAHRHQRSTTAGLLVPSVPRCMTLPCPQGRNVSSPFCDNKGGILFFKKPHGFLRQQITEFPSWLSG